MGETLFIRLGSQATDRIHWLIKTNGQDDIIASGELSSANELSQLTEKASARELVVFVSASDVALKSLTVPGSSSRAIRSAAPYMLEDDLAQEVEQLFFAYSTHKADAQGHNCFVGVVEHAQMQQWQTWLSEAGLSCKLMIPDALALPYQAEQITMVMLGQQILLRAGQWQAMSLDENLWQSVIPALINEEDSASKQLVSYSPLPDSDSFDIKYLPEELPLALLAEHYSSRFNLLQGEFQIKDKRPAFLTQWLWVAGIAAIALTLNFVYKGVELYQLSAQQQQIEDKIIEQYKATFPKTKKVKISTIRSQLKQKLKAVGNSDDSVGFLSLLNRLEPALAKVIEIKPQNLKFDGKRQEVRMQAIAKDYQYFEQLKVALENEGLTVNLGAQNNQGDQISGSFSITTTKTRGRS